MDRVRPLFASDGPSALDTEARLAFGKGLKANLRNSATLGVPYAPILATLLARGLICFALICSVNARYRIVPKADGDDIGWT